MTEETKEFENEKWTLEKIANLFGYQNKWRFVQMIIFDIALLSILVYFGNFVTGLTLICPSGTESIPNFTIVPNFTPS
jgi:hypothetical protein